MLGLLVLAAVGIGATARNLAVVPSANALLPGECPPGEYCVVPGSTHHWCPGECYSGTNTAYLGLKCAPDGSWNYNPLCTSSSPTSITISNVHEISVTSTGAQIGWSTNISGTHTVMYDLTSPLTASAITVTNPLAPSTTHSVTLSGLSPGTTYWYSVRSVSSTGQTATSAPRSFITTGAPVGGSLPTFTYGPNFNISSNQMIVDFRTSVATAALVEYHVDATGAPTFRVCNDAANCPSGATDWPEPNVTTTNHSITLTGLSATTSYILKVTIKDAGGNVTISGEFNKSTSGSSTDHIFVTGNCNGGTQIGQCTADGRYCRPGGGDPVFDCRPTTPCPHACTSGYTCQDSGDCTPDAALGNSPTQCNQRSCYLKCDGNSGGKAGLRCSTDLDCLDGVLQGRCREGSFVEPAASGCYRSWPRCSANTILQVRPDRVCDKWYSCKTSVALTDETGKTENQCFDLTICNGLSPNGSCSALIEGRQCSNDPLRFCTKDSDCIGAGATCNSPTRPPSTLTFQTPEAVGRIADLTGFAYVGLDWHLYQDFSSRPLPEGYVPLSLAKQVGTKVTIPNGDFETIQSRSVCTGTAIACSNDSQCQSAVSSGSTCVGRADVSSLILQQWQPVPSGTNGAAVGGDSSGLASSPNHFMKVTPTSAAGSGAESAFTFETSTTSDYYLSVRLKSSVPQQKLKVSLRNESGGSVTFAVLELTTGFQRFQLGPMKGPGGTTHLQFLTTEADEAIDFFVDDISMFPALQVGSNVKAAIPQTCRLYPRDDAPACDYIDVNGFTYRGLKGFCLERDPRDSSICLQWWPVDILQGENVFGQDTSVGYAAQGGRAPLYACAEVNGRLTGSDEIENYFPDQAKGSAPRNPQRISTRFDSCSGSGIFNSWPRCTPWTIEMLAGRAFCQEFGDPGEFPACPYNCDNVDLRDAAKASRSLSGKQEFGMKESEIAHLSVWNMVRSDNCAAWPDGDIENDAAFQSRQITHPTPPNNPGVQLNYGRGIDVQRLVHPSQWPTKIVWAIEPPAADHHNCEPQLGNCIAFYAIFNDPDGDGKDGTLESYQWNGNEETGTRYEGTAYGVRIYLRAPFCSQLVKVADFDRNAAWTDRVTPASSYLVSGLNYRYGSDLTPYGGSVAPDVTDPSFWSPVLTPLPVEVPNADLPPPAQPRAGSPTACTGDCSRRICTACTDETCFDGSVYTSKRGQTCVTDADCNDGTHAGKCIGLGACGRYDPITRGYILTKTPSPCTNNTQCSSDMVCVGGSASSKGAQSFVGNASSASNAALNQYSQYRLQRLFAQAYGVWTWDPSSWSYQRQRSTPTNPWLPPAQLCKVCDAGLDQGKACTVVSDCAPQTGVAITCKEAVRHPSENATNVTGGAADYCAIKPSVVNISDVNANGTPRTVSLDEGGIYILRFNTIVSRDQLPITEIDIDWGDQIVNRDGQIAIAPKDDPANPHAYSHAYHCAGSSCRYQTYIRIKDNWGWCNNGSNASGPCPGTVTSWVIGPTIIVKQR